MALFISMRNPRLIWTWPRSSTQGTRKRITRSGSTIRSTTFAWRYSACLSRTMASDSATSWTAWWNSGSAGFFAFTSANRDETKAFMASPPFETGRWLYCGTEGRTLSIWSSPWPLPLGPPAAPDLEPYLLEQTARIGAHDRLREERGGRSRAGLQRVPDANAGSFGR